MNKTIIFIILVLSITTLIAENPLSVELFQGKNNILINESFPAIYASELVKEYPSIKSISISAYGTTFGYVNEFGGIGPNLIIEPGKEYEIFVNESAIIFLKG